MADLTFTTKFQSKTPVQVMEGFIKLVEPNAYDLQQVGDWLAKRIKTRTISGIDYMGEPFAPYSASYAAEKGSSQVTLYSARRATSQSKQMDLFEHGPAHMLDSIKAKVEPSSTGLVLEVGIFDNPFAAKRGRYLQEGWQPRGNKRHTKGKMRGRFKKRPMPVPPRPWMGASQEDKVEMRKLLEEDIKARAVRFLNS